MVAGVRAGPGGSLLATVPTTGDIGLTWDEPAYRYSQVMSAQWWERLATVRGPGTTSGTLLDPTRCCTTGLTAGTGSTSIRRWPVS